MDSVGKPLTETNLYLYANTNPVTYTDPLGLFPVIPGIRACLGNQACARALMAGIAATITGIQNAINNLSKAKTEPEQCPDGECEELLRIDMATCNGMSRKYGAKAGAICRASANQRYAECLRFGIGGVRTPLATWRW